MKDNWFELMLSFFEKTITHLKERQQEQNTVDTDVQAELEQLSEALLENSPKLVKVHVEQFASPKLNSLRVFTPGEQIKLTRASQQFLMRMASWKFLTYESLELIMHRLCFSETRIVSLQETKWAIRNVLSNEMNAEQLAFLDVVLYDKEDNVALH